MYQLENCISDIIPIARITFRTGIAFLNVSCTDSPTACIHVLGDWILLGTKGNPGITLIWSKHRSLTYLSLMLDVCRHKDGRIQWGIWRVSGAGRPPYFIGCGVSHPLWQLPSEGSLPLLIPFLDIDGSRMSNQNPDHCIHICLHLESMFLFDWGPHRWPGLWKRIEVVTYIWSLPTGWRNLGKWFNHSVVNCFSPVKEN